MFEKLFYYFQFEFVIYALVVGVLIALCSSLFGVTLVLRRLSFIGDGLSHVAFLGVAAAAVMNMTDNMLVVLPVTILCEVLVLCAGQNSKIKGDASMAVLSVGALAIGYLILNIFSPSANVSADVCGTLFGSVSILTLKKYEVFLCAAVAAVVVLLFVMFYNRIFSVTFDEDFARATGIHAGVYNVVMAVIIAVIIVLGMKLVGSLLITALVVFPALSAMRLFSSYRTVTVFSAVFSVVCAVLGIIAALLTGAPVGSAVVAADIIGFAVCVFAGAIVKRV